MGKAEKIRFYNISEASMEELKYFFILSKDLEYIRDNAQVMEDAETISKMLYRLIEAIKNSRQ